jgi:hypothetical protein
LFLFWPVFRPTGPLWGSKSSDHRQILLTSLLSLQSADYTLFSSAAPPCPFLTYFSKKGVNIV